MCYNSLGNIIFFMFLVRNIPYIFAILLQLFYKLLIAFNCLSCNFVKNHACSAIVMVTKVVATGNATQHVCYGINTSQFLVNPEWMGYIFTMYNEILLTIRCDLPEGKGCCEPQARPGNCTIFFIFQRYFCLGGLNLNLCITVPDWCVKSQLCANLLRVKVRILNCFKAHLHTCFSPTLHAGSCKFSTFIMGVPGNIIMSGQ